MKTKRIWWISAALVFCLVVLRTTAAPAADEGEQPQHVEVGQEAPRFELESLDGIRLDSGQVRGETPLVLIFFRGTW